jgi:hypothetical protein
MTFHERAEQLSNEIQQRKVLRKRIRKQSRRIRKVLSAMERQTHKRRWNQQRDQRCRVRNRKYLIGYKTSHPCVDCGESRSWCLDFDHRNPIEKKFEINDYASKGRNLELLIIEIEKCDVRCANCHRDRHHRLSIVQPKSL